MKKLDKNVEIELLAILKERFESNMHRHSNTKWEDVISKLNPNPEKLWTLNEMENTGGEPDVVIFNNDPKVMYFVDCSKESPKWRRSFCYDNEALESRKKHKPENSAINSANELKINLLNEEQYKSLQELEHFDEKTSSWLETPKDVRKLGGAIFGDYRFGRVFIYHNGAESYYAARGYRGYFKL